MLVIETNNKYFYTLGTKISTTINSYFNKITFIDDGINEIIFCLKEDIGDLKAIHYLNRHGAPHHPYLPAYFVTLPTCEKHEYYLDGQLHRIGGPAVEFKSNNKNLNYSYYYEYGKQK